MSTESPAEPGWYPDSPLPPFTAAREGRALPIFVGLGLVAVAAVIGAVVAAVMLSSTSSKAADENAIRTTLATYDTTNDGKTACAQLAPSILARKPNCVANLSGAGDGAFARVRASIRAIKIHGNKATAVLGLTAAHGRYKLEKISGKWRIAGAPQAGLPSG
jgi:hypothetical protein